ncbi:hypothetical protein, partial [Porphyromonas cangingivalis]|uniref:hypothetical protein n=1 Tax=Porphyromonas cangingivalis TaxID=36874 RepID=UPI001F27B1A7
MTEQEQRAFMNSTPRVGKTFGVLSIFSEDLICEARVVSEKVCKVSSPFFPWGMLQGKKTLSFSCYYS